MPDSADEQLFTAVHDARTTFYRARMRFHRAVSNKAELLSRELKGPRRSTAIDLLGSLTDDELLRVLPELVFLTSFVHGDLVRVRALVAKLPLSRSLATIRASVFAMLDESDAGHPEAELPVHIYRRFMELARQIQNGLALDIAIRAGSHPDPEVREVAADYFAECERIT